MDKSEDESTLRAALNAARQFVNSCGDIDGDLVDVLNEALESMWCISSAAVRMNIIQLAMSDIQNSVISRRVF